MRTHLAHLSLALASLLVSACESPTPTPDGGSVSVDGGGLPDGGSLPECTVAAPLVAGTAATDALANAPPRCGAASAPWLRSDQLGAVVSRTEGAEFTRGVLRGLAAVGGVTLPRDPEHDVRTESLVYVTQDRGALVQSTALIAYPTDLDQREEVPILLVLHGTSGFRPSCGPTADSNTAALAALLASYGWIAVAPDYLGLENAGQPYGQLHPYLVPEPTALASLDAARAAARLVATDRGALCAAPRLALFGGSQGGHAVLWVDRLAPYYARELEILGGVATVPTADLVGQAQRALTEVLSATGNMTALIATQAPWYGRDDALASILTAPYDVVVPAALAASCDPGDALDPPSALDDLFTTSFLERVAREGVAAVEPVGCWLTEASLTTTSIPRLGPSDPSYGLLFVVASEDRLIHPPIERDAYDALCAAGVPLQYLECAGAGHVQGTLWAIPEVLDFIDARRAGDAFTPECARPAAVRCLGTPADR